MLLDDATSVGLDQLVPVDPIPPRSSLLDDVPASFLARDGDRHVLGVCSVGVDLGLVPEIADQWQRHGPEEVRIVLPRRDRLPVLVELCGRLPVPASFIDVDVPWSSAVA